MKCLRFGDNTFGILGSDADNNIIFVKIEIFKSVGRKKRENLYYVFGIGNMIQKRTSDMETPGPGGFFRPVDGRIKRSIWPNFMQSH